MRTYRFKKCDICGEYRECEIHHVFGGLKRAISDKYGAVVSICRKCHSDIHSHPAKYEWLKAETQKKVMEDRNWDIDEWFDHFGKNYI